MLLGGVTRDHLLSQQDEVVSYNTSNDELSLTRRLLGQSAKEGDSVPRPLLAGHSAVPMPDGSVVVVGGGATCFSMGTFWNKGVYTLRIPTVGAQQAVPVPRWVHEKTVDILPTQRSPPAARKRQETGKPPHITPIPRVKLETADGFLKIVRDGKPVVLEGLDLGSCVSAWTLDYLIDKVGADRKVSARPQPLDYTWLTLQVVIHEAESQAMDFTAKNFKYVTTYFGDFALRLEQGHKLYLRALSQERPSEKPAVLSEDFPALAPDFVLPRQLSLVAENLFSSVLRMSGLVNMWLHYDVSSSFPSFILPFSFFFSISSTLFLIFYPTPKVISSPFLLFPSLISPLSFFEKH